MPDSKSDHASHVWRRLWREIRMYLFVECVGIALWCLPEDADAMPYVVGLLEVLSSIKDDLPKTTDSAVQSI